MPKIVLRSAMLDPEDVPFTNVLLLYIGGTIGMKPLEDGTLAPRPGHLTRVLAKRPQFHDPMQPPLTTEISQYGRRVHYKIKEYSPLVDSSTSVHSMTLKVYCFYWTWNTCYLNGLNKGHNKFFILFDPSLLTYESCISFQ